MLIILIKIIVVLFFAYIAYDAFRKSARYRKDAEDTRFNRNVLEVLAKRQYRKGVFFAVITLIAFASLFFTLGIEKMAP
jgi:threonine/homoserine/homoserine lactone efflux protein